MSDKKEYKYGDFIDQIILAIEAGDEDDEMQWRADCKNHFRRTDEQINAALFKKFSKSKSPKRLLITLGLISLRLNHLLI